jgi:hypothetical protein
MSDELAPVSERRVAFGESLMKIETAFAYFQKAFINVEEIDYTDAIAQYREFDDLYQLLDTEYVFMDSFPHRCHRIGSRYADRQADQGSTRLYRRGY